jgi:uncharacterized protein
MKQQRLDLLHASPADCSNTRITKCAGRSARGPSHVPSFDDGILELHYSLKAWGSHLRWTDEMSPCYSAPGRVADQEGRRGTMRRHEQEITDKAIIEDVMRRAPVCRIGLADNNMPYIIPVCFGYQDNCIYVHSSHRGRKMEIIERNNNVCFEVEVDVETVPAAIACKWSVRYKSVIGFGKASIVTDAAEKSHALNVIMEHYSGEMEHRYDAAPLQHAAIIKIHIESITGKRSKQ